MIMAPSDQLTYLERVVMEIVDTERTYVRDLRMVVEEYLSAMIEHVCVRPELVCSLFGNIEDIYEFNSELLQDLELCDGDPVGVARCFVMKSKYFHIYTQYCTNYPSSVAALTECMRNKLLSKFLRERQTTLNRSLPLGSFLLKPVQRVLKYHLLLQEISKHFDPDHEGSEVVDEALHTMTGVAWYINDMKRKHEHAVRLQEVQSLLLGWKGSELTAYGELLLEGTFRVHRAKNRTLFLLERLLLISKQRGEHYVYKTHLSSSTLMLMQSSKDSLSFSVAHYKHPKQAHTIQARTVEEKKQWTHHIKRIIVENHHAVIPQKAKDAILEMDSVYPLRYPFSPERKKKTQDLKLGSSNQRQWTSAAAEPALPPQGADTGSDPYLEGTVPKRAQFPLEKKANPAGPCRPAGDPKLELEPSVDSDSKVLSSTESSEDEGGDGRDSSILPSSVLDRAGDIALHGSARRRCVASEESMRQGAVASQVTVSPLFPSTLSRNNSANWSPQLRKCASITAPPCPPLSPPDNLSEQRGQEFTLSERDQLLIGHIKAYYENAANQDEAFTLRRRESLTSIPNGLVRDSVSRFTRNQDPEPHSEDLHTEPGSDLSHLQNQEQSHGSSSEEVFRPSSEVLKIWQQMELKESHCSSWPIKKLSPVPLSQNLNHQDITTVRTHVKSNDTTPSQSVKEDPKGVPPRDLPIPLAPRVQFAVSSDVSSTQRTVLSLARHFNQQTGSVAMNNQQSVSEVHEEGARTSITDCVGRTRAVCSDKHTLQLTPGHGPPPQSVEAFDWPHVRELRCKYDKHRSRLKENYERRSSTSEEAPPQMLLFSSCSDPGLLHTPDRTGSVDPHPSHAVYELPSSSENFVGFRVAAETPLLTDPKHKILVLEKLPEIIEEPRRAGENNSYVQIRSPTSREKISIMAVMERCRVYEDSEENRLREQSVVRNLREKFQSLS